MLPSLCLQEVWVGIKESYLWSVSTVEKLDILLQNVHQGKEEQDQSKERLLRKKICSREKSLLKGWDGVSDLEEEDSDVDRNEILFLAMEDHHQGRESSREDKGVVDLQAELVAALDEIDGLKDINEKQEK